MNGGIAVVSLFGIEVRVSVALAVMVGVVVLIGADQASVMAPDLAGPLQWLVGVGVGALFLVSVVVHELAHALVGRRRGVVTTSVVLGLVGSLAPLSIQASRPKDELAIAAAGPLASLLIAVVVLPVGIALGYVGTPVGPLAGGLFIVGALNLMIGIASAMPGIPLDGGRMVRAAAWARTGDPDRAALATARSGRFLGWAVVGAGVVLVLAGGTVVGLLLVALGWLLGGASRGLEQRAQIERVLRGVTVREALVTDVAHVAPGLTVDTFADRLGVDGAPRALAVVDGDRVVGVVGVTALRRLGQRRFATARAADVMATPPRAPLVSPSDEIWGVMEAMQRENLDGLAVVEEERLVGVVTRDSAAEAMRAHLPAAMLWPRRGR